MDPSTAILITLVAYKVGLVGLGLYARKKTSDGDDFFLGGRQLGPWVAALSASASSSSAWTLLGVSGAAYRWGVSAVWLYPACLAGFLFNWYVLAGPLRRWSHEHASVTVTDVCLPRGDRTAATARRFAAFIIVFSLTVYVASQFQGAGKTFAKTFEVSEASSIVIGAAIVLVYTLLGGFWAVSLTDTVQGFVMALACVVLPVAALTQCGGPWEIWNALSQTETMTSFTRGFGPVAAIGFIAGTLGIGLGYPGQPHVVNRFMALRQGDRELRVGRRVAIGWALIVYAGMLLLGWAGRALYPELKDVESLFIHSANDLLPPVVAGVLLAAVLSAIMSTADSQLLVAASAITHDAGVAGKENQLSRSRWVVLGVAIVALGFALFGTESIFKGVLFAWTAVGAALAPSLIATVFWGRQASGRVLASMAAGFLSAVLFYLVNRYPGWFAGVLGEKGFGEAGGGIERVAPFVLSTIALRPTRPR